MPDVKWYAGSSTSSGVAVAAGSGTTNVLMKFDASDNAADSSWTDASNLLTSTSSSGLGLGTATPKTVLSATLVSDAVLHVLAASNAGHGIIEGTSSQFSIVANANGAGVRWFAIDNSRFLGNIVQFHKLGDDGTSSVVYQSFNLSSGAATFGSASVAGLTLNPGTGEISTTAGASFNIGNAATAPASNYLVIGGVSGAGGTPTTTHLTAGSGVAIYVQEAHDAQATKFVIAYNNYNGINYLVGTLDGSTATWTNSTTRP